MTKTTLINPILRKDALVNARSPKMIIVVTMINCLFAIIASVAFAMSFGSGYQAYYSYIVKLFPILGGCELAIICMVLPVMTATSIAGERERQTLEIMLTTPVRSFSIIAGKLASAMVTTFMYVVATLPFLAVSFVVGGLGWKSLFEFIGIVLYVDIYIGSFGMFYSCVRKTSVSATISTIITVVTIVLISYLAGRVMISAMYMTASVEAFKFYQAGIRTIYALNPFLWIFEFADQTFYADSLLPSLEKAGGYTVFMSDYMTWISVIFNLTVAVVMLKLASAKLRSGNRRKTLSKKEFDL